MMNVNVKAIFLAARHVIPVMICQGGAVILNTAGVLDLTGVPEAAVIEREGERTGGRRLGARGGGGDQREHEHGGGQGAVVHATSNEGAARFRLDRRSQNAPPGVDNRSSGRFAA